jgi:hypothetical protein
VLVAVRVAVILLHLVEMVAVETAQTILPIQRLQQARLILAAVVAQVGI